MIIKQFNNLEEIQKYYDEGTNTYVFKENGSYIDLVIFEFNLETGSNIDACDIKARNIKAKNIYSFDITAYNIDACYIYARDIKAVNINVENIVYYAVCVAYKNIKCKLISSRLQKAKHFVLEGELEIESEQ